MKIANVTGTYCCRSCNATFTARQVKLRPLTTNAPIQRPWPMTMMLINNKGRIVSTDKAEKGDRAMHCPGCDKVHLFGFNRA